jgi:fatty acid CoA ligase FadD9
MPNAEVAAAAARPNMPISQILAMVMETYADRPAIGMRRRELWTDPATGSTDYRLLPEFETKTYGEIWASASAVAAEWAGDRCSAGDFIAIIGFNGADYTTLDIASLQMGAVVVPLPVGAPGPRLAAILDDAQPLILAAGARYLEAAVDAMLFGSVPRRLVVFDCDDRVDAHREAIAAARHRIAEAALPVRVDTLDQVIERGRRSAPAALFCPAPGDNPLRSLTYTSGSTGSPKGVMFTERAMRAYLVPWAPIPMITLSYLPMSHAYGRGTALAALAHGGTVYFTAHSDMSTILDDMALVRPTMLSLVPRVCELLHHQYLRDVGSAADREAEAAAKTRMRDELVGGRVLTAMCGSAPLPRDTADFVESMLGFHLSIGYGGTEMGSVLVDNVVQRPPVIDYKLVDVPELGYFSTDRPHPRGELLVKTESFMDGYYKQPDLTADMLDQDGYYKTNDIMAETAPDRLVFVDRRNNVIKLAQGEFVAVSRLEAWYAADPAIDQIYLYGDSLRSHLVGVVVPPEGLRARLDNVGPLDQVKADIRLGLQRVAIDHHLSGYEIPRDFIVETAPFSQENSLLGGAGKLQRPALEALYRDRFERLYGALEAERVNQLSRLRAEGAAADPRETLALAVQATLGIPATDVKYDARFVDIGGDSLAALSLSHLLRDIYDIEVPVGVINDPAANLDQLADRIARQLQSHTQRPTIATVHGAATVLQAADLTLDRFIDGATLAGVASLPRPSHPPQTILLTGATGFLGRRLMIDLLRRVAAGRGRLVCLARGVDAHHARERIEAGLDTDPELIAELRGLETYFKVVAGDIGEAGLGLADSEWIDLANSVDQIVHVGAHVNHVLPYDQLFGANVVGTSELIKLALMGKLKAIDYISTLAVLTLVDHVPDEDSDVRVEIPAVTLRDSYGSGYAASKWAAEVLLREAADIGVPVNVFRSGMILADRRYVGQLNVPDIFTRLLVTILATGIAPTTFYAPDGSDGRPRATYSALTVDTLSAAVAAVGARATGIRTYNTDPGCDNGISLDTMVDWLIDGGRSVARIDDYAEWVSRCQTAMAALPPALRRHSLHEVMSAYRHPVVPTNGPVVASDGFRAATRSAGVELPPLSRSVIDKYVEGLDRLRLLG